MEVCIWFLSFLRPTLCFIFHFLDINLFYFISTHFNYSLSWAQPLLKKYLEFEKTVGDEERIEYVKKAALEYAKTNLGIETED